MQIFLRNIQFAVIHGFLDQLFSIRLASLAEEEFVLTILVVILIFVHICVDTKSRSEVLLRRH